MVVTKIKKDGTWINVNNILDSNTKSYINQLAADILSHTSNTNNPHNVTAELIGAEQKGAASEEVSIHNTNIEAHEDIRDELTGLSTRIDTEIGNIDILLSTI